MADYWKSYDEIRTFFKNTKKVFCPVIKAYVYFDRSGFRHLLIKKHAKRPIPDQIRRFKLLSRIKEILISTELVVTERDGFCALSLSHEERTVRIVTSKLDNGDVRYISIMEHRIRKAPKGLS